MIHHNAFGSVYECNFTILRKGNIVKMPAFVTL